MNEAQRARALRLAQSLKNRQECEDDAADLIAALLDERETFYMDYRIKCDEQTKVLHVEVERLKAERAALARDAARYRWLRGQAQQNTAYDIYKDGGHWGIGFFSDDNRRTFDEAIDAAMKGASNES